MYRILWCEYFNLTPASGIVEDEHHEHFYFIKMDHPSFVASVEGYPLMPKILRDHSYRLYRISKEQEQALWEDHERMAHDTGFPLRYGDAWQQRPGLVKFRYRIGVDQLRGSLHSVINESDISNFAPLMASISTEE